ncbi:MAG: hypothetical protein MZV64_32375 [Ignavibacteriales bacterium]|nr:hypothetical protein [Ignavibacteriales bacterium]
MSKIIPDQLIEVPDLQVKSDEVEKEIDNLLRSNSSQEEADAIGDDDNFLLDVELTRMDESGQPAADSKPEKMQIDLSNENVHPDIKANCQR